MTQDAAVQAARLATDAAAEAAWGHLHPASVTAYSEMVPVTVTVRPDGAETEIPARNLVNRPLQPGARVMLSFAEPGAALIVGIIGRLPPPMTLWKNVAGFTLAADVVTTITWDQEVVSFGGMTMDSTNGHIQIPYTGIYACYASLEFDGFFPANDELWQRGTLIKRVDSTDTLLDTVATSYDQWAAGAGFSSVQSAANPGWYFNAGEYVVVQGYDRFGADVAAGGVNKLSVRWVAQADIEDP